MIITGLGKKAEANAGEKKGQLRLRLSWVKTTSAKAEIKC